MKARRARLLVPLLAAVLLLSSCASPLEASLPQLETKTLLTVLVGESTSDPGIGDMLRERVESAFPGVELEWESVDWGEGFSARLSARIASGETPDIIIGKAQDVYAFQPTGALGVFPQELGGLLTPEGTASTTLEGKLYGLTYNQLYQGVLYNKNIFYRYNLQVPETLREMEQVVERLQSVGVTPFATHFQETWYTGNILMQFAIGEVFEKTPDWGERLRAGEVSFGGSPYRLCCEQVLYQFQNSWPDVLTIAQGESDLRFAGEEAAMYLTGTWSMQTLQSVAPYRKLGIFPYPTLEGGAKLISEPNITFMKSASTRHDALIDEILGMVFTDEELAQTLCAFTQTDTTLAGVRADSLSMIREDIEKYRAQNRIISAAAGNNQLIWAFQYDCAQSLMDYLQGKVTLHTVLSGWDALRQESSLGR